MSVRNLCDASHKRCCAQDMYQLGGYLFRVAIEWLVEKIHSGKTALITAEPQNSFNFKITSICNSLDASGFKRSM